MGYWFDHPIPGTIVATVTAYGYMERKQIVDEILDFTYENGETAQKNALRVNLYDWLGIETSQKKYTEEEKESSLKTLSQKENLEKACIMDSMLQEIGLWEDTKTKTLAYALLNITETTYTEEESKPILTKFKLEEGKDKQIWIDALVEKIYGEEKTRKKLNARLKLYDWALIKEWATNTLDVEYKIILEEVIGDPVKAINEYWPRIWELIKSWKWAFGINDVGELFCFAGTLSLPIQLGDIAKEQYKLITHAFFSDENQGGVMIPVTTGAVTCIVFGKMSFRGFQAYGEIIKKAKGAENYAELLPKLLKWEWTPSTLWRLLKTNGLFLTKDGRYVINSTLRWFPGAESLYLQRKALHIKESLNTIDDIKDLLWELDQHSKDLKTAIDYDLPEETKKYKELIEFKKNKIKTLTSKIKDKLELHSFAEKSSKKWLWSHLFETKYIKRLKTIAAELDSISTNTVTNDYEWARKLSTEVGKSLWRYQTRLSSLLSYSPVGLARKILIEPPSSKKLEKKVNKGRNKIVKSGENFNKMINVADEAIDEAERLEEIAQRSGKAKDIKKAEEAKKLADRLTRAVELGREAQEKAHAAEQAMQAAHDAQELAEAGRDTLNSTRLAKDAEEAYKIAREAANEARNAERAAAAARFNKLREIINKGGKIADIGGKTLGVIGAWVNVGTGGYEIYKGLANENEAQGNIQIAQGGVKVTSGWIEAATLTTAWALGGLIVANVEIYKYMINKGLESAAEATMTSDDWANKETNTLIHDLLSTVDDINAGDAYRAFASLKTSTEDILKEKIETRQKIIEALILKEGISDQAIIADRINFFTDTSVEFNFNDRDTFLKLLNQSRTYAQAMQYARQEKADGKTEVILELNQHRNINLLDPKTKKIRIAHAFQKLQKKEITPKIPETRLANFEKLDETTILYMLNCLGSYLASKQNEKTTEIENFHKELELYAKGVRNIFFQPRIIQNVTKEEIDKFISLTAEENATPKKMEENIHDIENTPEAFALFEVAKMFDYSGKGKITDLQNFFSENKKGEHGIYWNGEEWVVNEAGLERDDKMGNNGKRTIHNMINRIRDNQNDILETRNNELVDIRTTYSEEKMGNFALEIAEKLEEGMERYKQNN